ncbi:kinase-like domain-containing protein [Mycena vitilis]|nr:kinase-like domain-containing protein [Mycena vitilis]
MSAPRVNNEPHILKDAILGGITGSGKYAQVLPGVDLYTGFAVAVKVVPQRQGDWLRREVQVLAKLQQLPSSSVARICEFRDHWTKNNCLCVAFERYGQNLTTALQTPRLSAFPMFQTKEITRQIIQAVGYLHDHGIIHTNLNPNNIVFVSNDTTTHQFYGMDNAFHERIILKSSEIRLVDFGGAREKASHCTGTVGTAGFRAPEIIAGWNWTETIDHFAIGCIVAQILTSSPLLQHSTDSKGEDFVVMDKILGPFPEDLAARIQWDFPAAVPSHGPQESLAQYPHPTTPKTLAVGVTLRARVHFNIFTGTD